MPVPKGQLKRVNRARETIWRLPSIDFSEKNPEFSAGELISFLVSLYPYTKSPIPDGGHFFLKSLQSPISRQVGSWALLTRLSCPLDTAMPRGNRKDWSRGFLFFWFFVIFLMILCTRLKFPMYFDGFPLCPLRSDCQVLNLDQPRIPL